MENAISYKKPPIKEAVYDLKFVFEGQVNISLFDELYQKLANEYPKRETLNQQVLSFKVGDIPEKNQFNSTGSVFGIRLASIDGLNIVQFRPDGVTFSRMEPYSGWHAFSAEAEKMIETYIEILKPKYISRLALRFVNSINIPETTFEISDYFNTEPKLADGIKASLSHFFMRQLIQNESGELFAIINQTTAQPDLEKQISKTIFDIDVYKDSINIQFKSEEYNELLSKLRDFRSEIFEESITEKTRKMFS